MNRISILIYISTLTRRLTLRSLRKNANKLNSISPDDRVRMSELNQEVRSRIDEMSRIISRTHGRDLSVVLPVKGFSLIAEEDAVSGEDETGNVIFDMTDGTHCYYLEDPGVCCCDPC